MPLMGEGAFGQVGESGPALAVRNLRKTFGAKSVLMDVSLTVAPGEIRALVGHNGSGKSTVIKILAGIYEPDSGEVLVGTRPLRPGNPNEAHRAGLRFVHQDLGLADSLNAVDNLAIGAGFARRASGRIDWPESRRRTSRALEELGLRFDVEVAVGKLTALERVGVAVARALHGWQRGVKAVVLDEPTSPMPAREASGLLETLRRLRAAGLGILLVTHHLDEALAAADSITVLRNGAEVCTREASSFTRQSLVEAMLGTGLATGNAVSVPGNGQSSQPVVALQGLGTDSIRAVDLDIRRGEVVGLAGLAGQGQEEVIRAVAGAITRRGALRVHGSVVRPGSPAHAARAGIAFVPRDRLRNGLFLRSTVATNLTISGLHSLAPRKRIRRSLEVQEVERWIRRFNIEPGNGDDPISVLSGGNQQKVLLARAMRTAPTLLALEEPTEGVDVGAREMIYEAIREAAAEGCAVLLSSSDSEELASLCTRVLVLHRGRVETELSGHEITADSIDYHSLQGGIVP
jgi:ribose transport system ATP-binding protein